MLFLTLEAEAKFRMLEIEFMAAKAERDRLQDSARMHTEAAMRGNEKAEKVRTPMLNGGLGRVIEEAFAEPPHGIPRRPELFDFPR